jgi:hypothetical protein
VITWDLIRSTKIVTVSVVVKAKLSHWNPFILLFGVLQLGQYLYESTETLIERSLRQDSACLIIICFLRIVDRFSFFLSKYLLINYKYVVFNDSSKRSTGTNGQTKGHPSAYYEADNQRAQQGAVQYQGQPHGQMMYLLQRCFCILSTVYWINNVIFFS